MSTREVPGEERERTERSDGLLVRVLGREVEGGWRCEDCGVVLADDVSLYAHREVVHPLAVEREHADLNGTMDRGDTDG